jgi:ABC-2 type transport system permease protein
MPANPTPSDPAAAYSQTRAMLAIARASLLSILRSPSSIVFGLLFPFIFIMVFGFLSSPVPVIRVGFAPGTDTASPLYREIVSKPNVVVVAKDTGELRREIEKGRITASLAIEPLNPAGYPRYRVRVTSSTASADRIGLLHALVIRCIGDVDRRTDPSRPVYAFLQPETVPGRTYRTIDFVLPGQLGFSLLSAGVFGVAFIFFNLRQTLVLKRFFATPVRRATIIVGEGLGRVVFQLLTAVVILGVGRLAFDFTLVNGWLTFAELLLLSLLGLLVFMGFGFIVSGLAATESAIPPFSNLVTLPQFLLAGTFFPVENFPSWLQPVCRVLPLTHLNEAMRNIAFEGDHLADCGSQIGYLLLWGVALYAVAIRVFRWDP